MTHHDWGRLIGDVNHVSDATLTPVPILLVTTDENIGGVGIGAHDDIERIFPAVEGEDPRGASALYDRMCDFVFKLGHQGAVACTIGAFDMALWDIKAKAAGEPPPLWAIAGKRGIGPEQRLGPQCGPKFHRNRHVEQPGVLVNFGCRPGAHDDAGDRRMRQRKL